MTRKTAPEPPAAPLPTAGGSWILQDDGSLRRAPDVTAPAAQPEADPAPEPAERPAAATPSKRGRAADPET